MSSTSNNGFAAFLILHNHEMVAKPVRIDGKNRFEFSMPRKLMDELFLEYTKSQFPAFDAVMRSLRRELR